MKVISVNLQVDANTTEARKNLSQLGRLLQEIGTTPIQIDSGPISQAVSAAQQLQVHLEKAVNVNTGKIDLNKLNTSLNSSNTNLLTLTSNLQKAGPIGQQAFLKVAQAISSAEMPLIKVNDKLKNFGVTLLNTIKWQLASNLIHGVQGAIEGAVFHAKELNSALSDIRIVTGHSIDYMSKFAAEAGKAAQELNTTTTEYSKAALIFFQQGLDGAAVSERVETVIKLSEVTGQSAEKISSQMTAIWNNFDDGSHNLEYYADVITKLGAATAASSDEIANGLSKFASIADTVGLSYEKASASLATVVAETRQSEEVVGTAFKTIFARIQGLSLGETLEDGVDLNKYSEALQTIGVNVLDSNGKLKEMDVILNELGKKWQLIGEEQKVATAETVAGVRQYNQFLALMNNYDEVLKNEDLAKSSTGTLKTQAKIWSESWEAASKRVQKSQQDLYESIINDKTLIKMEDMFSGLINGVNNFIKSSGGIIPILASVVAMASRTLFPLLQNGFKQLHNNIKIWSGDAAQDFAVMQGALSGQMSQLLEKNTNLSNAERQQIEVTQDLIHKKTLLTLQSKSMSEAEKIEAQNKIAILEATGSLAKAALERQANAEKELATILKLTDAEEKYRIALSKQMVNLGDSEEDQKKRQILETAQERGRDTSTTQQNIQSLEKQIEKPDSSKEKIEQLEKERVQLAQQGDILGASEKAKEIKQITQEIEKQNKELVEQLDIEKQILKAQEEAKKAKINSKNEFGIQDINSYKDKDENDVDLYNTTNEMIGNTIGNNKDLGAGDADTIKISEEAYKALAQAEIEAKMASEDFSAMSTELNTLLATNAEEIKKVDAATVKVATDKRAATEEAEQAAKAASKEANAERLNVQNLKNQLTALKNSKTSHSEIIQVKSKLATAEQKLQNATKEEIKKQQEAKKAMQELIATTTPASRVFSNISTNVHEMGSKLGLTKKDLNEFDQQMKQALNQETAEDKIKAVQAILDKLANSSEDAGFAFEQMGIDMQKALTSEGFSAERLEKVKNGIQEAAEATHDAKQATDQYGGTLDENDKKQKKIGDKLTGIATVLGKVAMGYNSLKSVVNIWQDDDVSLMDKIMTTFTSISMILPVISGEYGLLNAVKAINNMLEKTGHSTKLKGLAALAAEKAAAAESTGSTWAYVAAKVAQKIAENGWAGIALGVALTAAIGIAAATINATAATEKNTKAIQEKNKATAEGAKTTADAANKWQEESNIMDVLIKKYQDLKNAQEDVTQVQQDIIAQVPQLIESYKELNKTLEGTGVDLTEDISKLEAATAAGDVDRAKKIKAEIDAKAAKATSKKTSKGADAAIHNMQASLKKNDSGASISQSGNKMIFRTGGYNEAEKKTREVLIKTLTEAGGTASSKQDEWFGNKNSVEFELDTSNNATFLKQYEALIKAKKEMEEQYDGDTLSKSDIYDDLKDILEDTEEQYNEAKELVGSVEQYQVEELASGIDLTAISDYADYEEKINQLKDDAIKKAEKNGEITDEEKEKIKATVDEWAKGKEVLNDYTTIAERLKHVENEYGEDVKNELTGYYKQLQKTDPDKAKLFLQVDFSKVASKEALKAELEYLQSEANHEEIQANLNLVKDASEAIKTDGTTTKEDWEKVDNIKPIIESAIEMSYENFLKLDANSQKLLLNNYLKNSRWEDVKNNFNEIASSQASKKALEQKQTDIQAQIVSLQNKQNSYSEAEKKMFKALELSGANNYEDLKNYYNTEISEKERMLIGYEDKRKIANEAFNGNNAHDLGIMQVQSEVATMGRIALNKEEMENEFNDLTNMVKNDNGAIDPEKMQQYITAYNDYINLPKEIQEAQKNLLGAEANYTEAIDKINNSEEKTLKVINDVLTSSTSLAELDENIAKIESYGVDMGDYHSSISTTLINLASNYENCSEEILNYQQAIASGSEELEVETEAILRNSIAVAELSEKLDLEADAVEEQAKELISANDLSKENYKIATKIAILNQSMNKGLQELVDNWDDYKNTLKTAQKGTQDYAEAALKTKKALSEMLGVLNADYIPDDFLELPGVMDLIDKATAGDIAAINELGATMAKVTIEAMEFKEGLKDINSVELDESQFETYKNEVLEGIKELTDSISNGTIKAGEDITKLMDGTGKSWVDSLNKMAYVTGMSVDEMNSLLNELGVETDVTTKTKMVKTQVPIYQTEEKMIEDYKYNPDGSIQDNSTRKFETSTRLIRSEEMDGAIEVAQINTGDDKGTPPSITYAGRDNPASSALTKSSSSSSSSSSPTTKASSHSHEVNRYSNEENAVNGLTKEYEKLGKAKDQAFGQGRIYAMEQELKALKELKQASGDYLNAIAGKGNADKIAKAIYSGKNIGSMISNGELGGTIKSDYNSLYSGLSASGKGIEYTAKDDSGNEWLVSDNYSLANFNSLFGTNVQFSLDSYGNLQNKDSILNLLQNLKNNENDAYSRAADPAAGSTTEYNKRIAYLDEMKSRIDQYGQTANLLTEKSNAYLEYISSIQEKNAEIISTKMENGVNLSQKTIQRLERAIKVLGDNIYKTAEAMQSWFNSNFKEGVDADKQKGDSAVEAIDEIEKRVKLYEENPLDENALSPAKVAELLSSAEDTLDGVVDSLLSRIQSGKEYYGQVLDYWNGKLEIVNQNIENNIKAFDHLQNILNLLGQSTDYEKQGQILQGRFQASQDNYNSRKRQAEDAKNEYEAALRERDRLKKSGISAEALEAYEEGTLQKALDDYNTKADAMYTALEETITLSNQLFENEINKIMQESEWRLAGEWGNFNDLDSAMKRQQSVTEEYLTKTNQLYETNTMLRKLSQDIDKIDSQIAKNKLKAFSDEIEAMQKQEKLSKSDLEIAKARYEVLQAQIALEETKNAKSTVRLQRDNEGNYGYIYTADQEKTTDAEQNLADKQNDLYNLLLTQAETYGQKSIEMRKEWQAEMQALVEQYQNDTSMSEEEFLMKQADINNKYREMEIAYQESFQTANTWLNQIGAEGQTEAWINSFDTVITQHRIFNDDSINELNGYNDEINSVADDVTNTINDKFQELKEQRDFFTEESKTDNEELQDSIDEVTSSVSQLSKSVTGKNGLADSMSTAMNKAQNLTTAFINQYSALQDLITKYSTAADEANKLYNRTADLVNVQVALNHANRGATSVSWGSRASSVYSDINSGGNGNGSNSTYGIDDTGSSSYKQRYAVHDYVTGKDIVVTEDQIEQYRLKGAGPSRYLIKKISKYGTPGHFKSGGYTGTWASAKTGMYTGSWNGPDLEENGKLAFLHQKELVLNADDTENILDAVKLIRQISQTIDLQAMAYNNSAFGLAAAHLASNNQTLQQEVTIHAEFPNVSDHNEIEEAFNNLVNRASQYANRY